MADGTPQQDWTTAEQRLLRDAYTRGGIAEAAKALPHRSLSALRSRAVVLRLHSPISPLDPARQAHMDRLRAAIRETYEKGIKWGDIKKLCERFECTRALVYQQVQRMGLSPVQLKAPAWTRAELELLEETAHLGINAAAGRFKRAGFKRSAQAIQVQRSRNQIDARTAQDDEGMRSTTALAELLGVSAMTITAWIKLGLKAELRGQPGAGRYLIRDDDLRRFIAAHPLRVNLTRIPHAARAWFVSMLSGL